ncbi:MAG: helix-turn-helix domain-containing protein [Bifidobacteriaceae bacterium]|jgi:predicted DNA-binding transcriptional regulator AlpA|nr:helix-turn-helix domain-containing protein [Bifidobacteriaceae bacterium]
MKTLTRPPAGNADLLLRTEAVAKWLAVSKSTLVRWRQSGRGPEVCWLAEGLPRYRAADVERWLAARSAGPARRPEGAPRAGQTR